VSGSEGLRPFVDDLKTIRFAQEFPDKRDIRIFRRGILSCVRPQVEGDPKGKHGAGDERKKVPTIAPLTSTCRFALIPTELTSLRDRAPANP